MTNKPTDEEFRAAYKMGAVGSNPTEHDRLLFEGWMNGHNWALGATWNGRQYVSPLETTGFCDAKAMNTRQIFAAWRDRGALAAQLAPPVPVWTKAADMLPPCRDNAEYIGINTAGFAGIFNAVADIAGNVHCMMETAEDSVTIMSDLDIWTPFVRPPIAAGGGKEADHG